MTGRFYMVTFDLENSKGRTNDYPKARQALQFLVGDGNYWDLVKQCAIVRTNNDARAIMNTLTQQLGPDCNVLVVRLRRGYAFKLRDVDKRAKARDCFQQIPSL
jgi:hypothetical protein